MRGIQIFINFLALLLFSTPLTCQLPSHFMPITFSATFSFHMTQNVRHTFFFLLPTFLFSFFFVAKITRYRFIMWCQLIYSLKKRNTMCTMWQQRSSSYKSSAKALPTSLTQNAMKIINYKQVETIKIFDLQRKRFYELH